jgi:ABC-type Co2+ transport system permease subunit
MVVVSLPALLAAVLFRFLAGPYGLPGRRRAFWAGTVTGFLTVNFTAGLWAAVVIFGGVADWTLIAAPLLVAYLALGAIEGAVLGAAAEYLSRVKPDMVGLEAGPTSPRSRTGA